MKMENRGRIAAGKVERAGMTIMLVVGLIFLIGGLFLVWRTGAYDIFGFGQKDGIVSGRLRNDIMCALHLPWIIGAWQVWAALAFFWNRKNKTK